jgi:hypothetical protein
MLSISDLIPAAIVLLILSAGFSYHLGWRHGWKAGFLSEQAGSEEQQPRANHPWGFIYGLGWHHGWDHGFREATRQLSRQKRSKDE